MGKEDNTQFKLSPFAGVKSRLDQCSDFTLDASSSVLCIYVPHVPHPCQAHLGLPTQIVENYMEGNQDKEAAQKSRKQIGSREKNRRGRGRDQEEHSRLCSKKYTGLANKFDNTVSNFNYSAF